MAIRRAMHKYLLSLVFIFLAHESVAFDLFIQTDYKNTPNFSDYGFKKSRIIYEQEFYGHRENRDQLPAKEMLQKIGGELDTIDPQHVVIDIETWFKRWKFKDQEQKHEVFDRYIRVLDFFQQESPAHLYGLYGVVPSWLPRQRYYSDKKLNKWQEANKARRNIASKVDFMSPSLYTYTQDSREWRKHAQLVMEMSRKAAKGKNFIPYIWPKYHQSLRNKVNLSSPYVPKSFWRIQLEFLYDNADGLIIWDSGNKKKDWNEDEAWWRETKSFLAEKNIVKSNVMNKEPKQ